MSTSGIFISLEGGEGVGKSTLQKRIGEFFSSRQIPSLLTREPGGTHLAEQVRHLLLSSSKDYQMNPLTETLLVLAARLDHLEKEISPALNRGEVVICDRFIDSTMAYQAYGRDGNISLLWRLCLEVVPILPDLTFYLDLPLDKASDRLNLRQRDLRDRMEAEHHSFHQKVREGFLDLSKRYTDRIVVLDARQEESIVAQQAIGILVERFPERFIQS